MHSLSLYLFLISGLKNDKYTSSESKSSQANRTVLGRNHLIPNPDLIQTPRRNIQHSTECFIWYPDTSSLVHPSPAETLFLLSCLDNSRVTASPVGFQSALICREYVRTYFKNVALLSFSMDSLASNLASSSWNTLVNTLRYVTRYTLR